MVRKIVRDPLFLQQKSEPATEADKQIIVVAAGPFQFAMVNPVITKKVGKYLANPKSGPCPFFKVGDEFILKRTPERDDFYHLMEGKFCGEAWDAISRYIYTGLQGGSIMKNWMREENTMICCCNDA